MLVSNFSADAVVRFPVRGVGVYGFYFFMESLILAQDERWRRA